MDLLMKFPDEATALEVGKRYGLYVQAPDGEPTVEAYTDTVEQPVMEQQEVEVQVPVLDENLNETGEFTTEIRYELVQVGTETVEVERTRIVPAPFVWVERPQNYTDEFNINAVNHGVHYAPTGETNDDGEPILEPVDGWWVMIRTDLPLSEEMAVFVVWNSDTLDPYPDNPETPKMAFA